jgi:hypothetical protein
MQDHVTMSPCGTCCYQHTYPPTYLPTYLLSTYGRLQEGWLHLRPSKGSPRQSPPDRDNQERPGTTYYDTRDPPDLMLAAQPTTA